MTILRLHFAVVDLASGEVRGQSGTERLTGRELSLLRYLSARPGRTVSRAELLRAVFDYHPSAQTRVVATTLRRLRAKLGEDPKRPRHLITVYGEGLRFERGGATRAPSLLGREAELHQLRGAHAQLIQITGPGGIGKTRLARALLEEAPGIWVELAGLTDAGQVAAALAACLGMPLADGRVLEAALAEGLRQQEAMWLVLDNVEAIDGLQRLLPAWMAAAPRLRWLLTSRRQLPGLAHEHLQLSALRPPAARALLAQRLEQAGQPAPAAEEMAWLVAFTAGNPLLLEFVAARAGLVGSAALVEHLKCTGLASLGSAGSGRHTSVRALVTDAVAMVPEQARALLHRLAAFPGAITPQQAGFLGEFTALQALRDANLITPPQPDGCFRVLVPIREVLPIDAAPLLRWAATFAQEAHSGLWGADPRAALDALFSQWSTLLHALRHWEADPAAASLLLGCTAEVGRFTGWPLPTVGPPEPRCAWANIAYGRDEFAQALSLIAGSERLADLDLRAACLHYMRAPEQSRQAAATSLARARQVGAPWELGRALVRACAPARHDEREALITEGVALLEASGDALGVVYGMLSWGRDLLARPRYRPREAIALLTRTVTRTRSWPPTKLGIQARLFLAGAQSHIGEADPEAIEVLRDHARKVGMPRLALSAEIISALVLCDSGHPAEAMHALDAAIDRAFRWPLVLVGYLWCLCLCCLRAGDVPRALGALEHLASRQPEIVRFVLSALAAAGGDDALAQDAAAMVSPRTRKEQAAAYLFSVPLARRTDPAAPEAAWRFLSAPQPDAESSLYDSTDQLRIVWAVVNQLNHDASIQRACATHLGRMRRLLAWAEDPNEH